MGSPVPCFFLGKSQGDPPHRPQLSPAESTRLDGDRFWLSNITLPQHYALVFEFDEGRRIILVSMDFSRTKNEISLNACFGISVLPDGHSVYFEETSFRQLVHLNMTWHSEVLMSAMSDQDKP